MNLTPELEQSIADKIATGMYPSSDDVIRAALQALDEKEVEAAKLADLRQAVDEGMADLAAGRLSTKTATELLVEIRRRKIDEAAKLADLRWDRDLGIADLAAGRMVPLKRELIESIKIEGRKRNAEKQTHCFAEPDDE